MTFMDDTVAMIIQVYIMDYCHPGTPLSGYLWMT